MLYLRILSVNFFVLVLLWTYRILPYFLLEYRVLNFNYHFARAVCSPFQGVFIVLFRTTYVCLRNSTTSLLPLFFFFFNLVLVRTACIHTVSLFSENKVHPLKVSYCLFFVEDGVHPFKESYRLFFVKDDVHPFKESYRLFFFF